jgi:DNA-directed RNA polymerase subunit M/transcription elongation factor TFIIS
MKSCSSCGSNMIIPIDYKAHEVNHMTHELICKSCGYKFGNYHKINDEFIKDDL